MLLVCPCFAAESRQRLQALLYRAPKLSLLSGRIPAGLGDSASSRSEKCPLGAGFALAMEAGMWSAAVAATGASSSFGAAVEVNSVAVAGAAGPEVVPASIGTRTVAGKEAADECADPGRAPSVAAVAAAVCAAAGARLGAVVAAAPEAVSAEAGKQAGGEADDRDASPEVAVSTGSEAAAAAAGIHTAEEAALCVAGKATVAAVPAAASVVFEAGLSPGPGETG